MISRLASSPAIATRWGVVLLVLSSAILVFGPAHFVMMALQNTSTGYLVGLILSYFIQLLQLVLFGCGVALLTAAFIHRMQQGKQAYRVFSSQENK